MLKMKLKHYEVKEKLKKQTKVEWILYVLLPGCTPPRHYWIRNIAFHVKGYFLLAVGIIFYLWVGYIASLLSAILILRSASVSRDFKLKSFEHKGQ